MIEQFFNSVPSYIQEQLKDLQVNITSNATEIDQLLNRTVLLGGKRLRPLLIYLMGDLFSLPVQQMTPLAQAIEKVHAASLAHDDVIDNETLRRGIASINVVGGNKRAVLAGDHLLADVIVKLVEQNNLALVQEMARVIQQLAQGEWLQLECFETKTYSRQLLISIAEKKTGSVMSWCCLAPALLANCSKPVVEYCRQFGVALGVAFQFVDDILDFAFNPALGEGKDWNSGVVNAVAYQLMEDRSVSPEMLGVLKFAAKEIERAQLRVRELVDFQLSEARKLLQIICREESGRIQQAALGSLDLMLSYLASRGE